MTDQLKAQDRPSVVSISQQQEAVSIHTFLKVILPTFLIFESHAEPPLLEEGSCVRARKGYFVSGPGWTRKAGLLASMLAQSLSIGTLAQVFLPPHQKKRIQSTTSLTILNSTLGFSDSLHFDGLWTVLMKWMPNFQTHHPRLAI